MLATIAELLSVARMQSSDASAVCAPRKVNRPLVATLSGDRSDYEAMALHDGYDGYDEILGPRFDEGIYRWGPEQDVPGWGQRRS